MLGFCFWCEELEGAVEGIGEATPHCFVGPGGASPAVAGFARPGGCGGVEGGRNSLRRSIIHFSAMPRISLAALALGALRAASARISHEFEIREMTKYPSTKE